MPKSVTLAPPSGATTPPTLSQEQSEQSVGEQLRQMRTARNLSLHQVARAAGVSAAALSRWENDQHLPRVPELEAVLRALAADDVQTRLVLLQMQVPRAVYKLRTLDGAGAFTSFGGDLLWALRRRKQWTQAETAAAAHITQARIARFENGDAWPNPTVLHRLCWCLDASPLEMEALTCQKDVSALTGYNGAAWNEMKSWDNDRWAAHLWELLHYPPADFELDLHMLVLEQRLLHLSHASSGATSRPAFFSTLLADAYAIHARHCVWQGQRESAARWAERGLTLKRELLTGGAKVPDLTTFWFGNVLSLVAFLQESNRPATLRRAARLLQEWLPAISTRDTQHSWAQMALASTLVKLGQFDAAVPLARKTGEEAAALNGYDATLRGHDLARVLLETGKPAEAEAALAQSTAWWPLSDLSPRHAASYHLLGARCAVALGDTGAYRSHIASAKQLVTEHALHPLQAELQSASDMARPL